MRTPFFAALTLLLPVIAPTTVQSESLKNVAAKVDSLESVLESMRSDMESIQAQLDSLQGNGEDDAVADSTMAAEPEPVVLNDAVGAEIDAEERERYGLFANIAGFRSATYLKNPDGSHVVKLIRIDEAGIEVEQINRVALAGIDFVRAKINAASD